MRDFQRRLGTIGGYRIVSVARRIAWRRTSEGYGATMDVEFIERHGLGVHGGGRSSTGVHAGLRAESYWALLAGAAVGALHGALAIGPSHN